MLDMNLGACEGSLNYHYTYLMWATHLEVLSQILDDWFLINHLTCNDLQDTSTLVGKYKTS